MVIDTSAIVAIARDEPEAADFAHLLANTPGKLIAAPTFVECAFVLGGLAPNTGVTFLRNLVTDTRISIAPFGEAEIELALLARSRFGRGSGHPAKLNFGDCFAYALAKARNVPLLFKGDDFIHTDVTLALPAAGAGA